MQDAQNEVLDALNERYAPGIVSAPAVRAYISRAYDDAFERQDELYKNDAARLYEGMEMPPPGLSISASGCASRAASMDRGEDFWP